MKKFIILVGLTALIATAAFAAQSKQITEKQIVHQDSVSVQPTAAESNSKKPSEEEYRITSKYWYMERPAHGSSRD